MCDRTACCCGDSKFELAVCPPTLVVTPGMGAGVDIENGFPVKMAADDWHHVGDLHSRTFGEGKRTVGEEKPHGKPFEEMAQSPYEISFLNSPASQKTGEAPGDKSYEFVLVFKKSHPNKKLGLELVAFENTTPRVKAVSGLPLLEWNKKYPRYSIANGDFITDVSGTHSNYDSMIERITTEKVVELRIWKAPE